LYELGSLGENNPLTWLENYAELLLWCFDQYRIYTSIPPNIIVLCVCWLSILHCVCVLVEYSTGTLELRVTVILVQGVFAYGRMPEYLQFILCLCLISSLGSCFMF